MIHLLDDKIILLTVLIAPLLAALFAGLGGSWLSDRGAHVVTITGVALSLVGSCLLLASTLHGPSSRDLLFYVWLSVGSMKITLGALLDRLSLTMMIVVSLVSLLVHIYSIGYMRGDSGYRRFFAYMSLFTSAMLILVSADNFLQLFLGWEGVGLVSYLLIGFWFDKPSAVRGSFKAFLVNRVGDFGFLLGIAFILSYVGSLHYSDVFAQATHLASQQLVGIGLGSHLSVATAVSLLLFVGAMGKSAQIPLHVWLPESMEGPTPISALIHAATMVTAGVYLLARMSPLYVLSPIALSVVLVVGATGALLLGLVGVVQNDIKRVIAYSTMSQLGYMVCAAGASAFAPSIFHLITHACFKALLFLGAGSVILGLHHEQDLRKMGGLRRYLPITYTTFLIGALALVAIPPFSGYYSKDAIIDAVRETQVGGGHYAYACLILGAFVTALYTFRLLFLAFHGEPRFEIDIDHPPHESSWVVWLPLVILAIPSVVCGAIGVEQMVYMLPGWLGHSIVSGKNNILTTDFYQIFQNVWSMTWHAVFKPAFWCSVAGVLCAWLGYVRYPHWPDKLSRRYSKIHTLLLNQYGFDHFNTWIFEKGSQRLSQILARWIDGFFIDQTLVHGTANHMQATGKLLRRLQTGYLHHYVLFIIMGLVALLWGLWVL